MKHGIASFFYSCVALTNVKILSNIVKSKEVNDTTILDEIKKMLVQEWGFPKNDLTLSFARPVAEEIGDGIDDPEGLARQIGEKLFDILPGEVTVGGREDAKGYFRVLGYICQKQLLLKAAKAVIEEKSK